MFTSSGSTGGCRRGGDVKTIISPNTLFGDIINVSLDYTEQMEVLGYSSKCSGP